MSYPRNAASPERIAIGPVILISDGTPQSSGVTVTVRGQGGAEAGSAGTIAYGATGVIVYYTPTQGETDFTSFTVTASKASCIPACVTVITSASATPGYAGVDWAKVTAPTTVVGLSGTTIKTATDIALGVIASERNVRQTVESQRGHHTGAGAIFYVQKGGNDANPGTYLLPFLTIQAALNACTANAHDTVIVLGVTGSSPSVFTEALTMSKAYVFLRGMGRDTKVTTAGAASSTITLSASGCEVSGFLVTNTGTGATAGIEIASGADFAYIHDTFIDGTGGSTSMIGLKATAGTNGWFERNRIDGAGLLSVCISVPQGAAVGTFTRILNNYLTSSTTGINFAGSDSSESVARFNEINNCTTGVVVAAGALRVAVTDNRFAGCTTDWTDAGTNTNTSWNELSTSIAGTVKADVDTIKTNPVVNAGTITFPTTATLASTTNITAGTITTATNLTTNNDKTGYGLSAAAVQAIWDALTAALTTVGSIGKKLADWTIGTAQTGDSFARLGAPAGASVSADIAAVKADTAAILVDTGTTLDVRIPAALVGGRMDASVGAMAAGVVTAAAVATDAIDADALAADAVTEIQAGLATPTNITAGTITTVTTLTNSGNVKKNTALAGFTFLMTDSTNHNPLAGLGAAITVTRSINGGAFAAGTLSAVTEVSNGAYSVDFGSADLNGNVVVLRATGVGADDTFERVITSL